MIESFYISGFSIVYFIIQINLNQKHVIQISIIGIKLLIHLSKI